MKYTQNSLDKVEKVVEETGYIVRYERGSFQSGFLPLEGRINTLIDLLPYLKIHADILTPESRKIYEDIMSRYHASKEAPADDTILSSDEES
jgi:hypothetical protein